MDTVISVAKVVGERLVMCKQKYEDLLDISDDLVSGLSRMSSILQHGSSSSAFRGRPIMTQLEAQLTGLKDDLTKILKERGKKSTFVRNFLGSCISQGHAKQLVVLEKHRDKLMLLIEDLRAEAAVVTAKAVASAAGGAAGDKIGHVNLRDFWVEQFKSEFVLSWEQFIEGFQARYSNAFGAAFALRKDAVLRLLRSKIDSQNDNKISVHEFASFFSEVQGIPEEADVLDVLKHHVTTTHQLLPAIALSCLGSVEVTAVAFHNNVVSIASKRGDIKTLVHRERVESFVEASCFSLSSSCYHMQLQNNNNGTQLVLACVSSTAPRILFFDAFVGSQIGVLELPDGVARGADIGQNVILTFALFNRQVRVFRRHPETGQWSTAALLVVSCIGDVGLCEELDLAVLCSLEAGVSVWDLKSYVCLRTVPNTSGTWRCKIKMVDDSRQLSVVIHGADSIRVVSNALCEASVPEDLVVHHSSEAISMSATHVAYFNSDTRVLTLLKHSQISGAGPPSARTFKLPAGFAVSGIFVADGGTCVVPARHSRGPFVLFYHPERDSPSVMSGIVAWSGHTVFPRLPWCVKRHSVVVLDASSERPLWLTTFTDQRVHIWNRSMNVQHQQMLGMGTVPFRGSIADIVVKTGSGATGRDVYLATSDGFVVHYNFEGPYTRSETCSMASLDHRKVWTSELELAGFLSSVKWEALLPEEVERTVFDMVPLMSRMTRYKVQGVLVSYRHRKDLGMSDVAAIAVALRAILETLEVDRLTIEAKLVEEVDKYEMRFGDCFLIPSRWNAPDHNVWIFDGEKCCLVCHSVLDKKYYIQQTCPRCAAEMSRKLAAGSSRGPCVQCGLEAPEGYHLCNLCYDVRKRAMSVAPNNIEVCGSAVFLTTISHSRLNHFGPAGTLWKLRRDNFEVIDKVNDFAVGGFNNIKTTHCLHPEGLVAVAISYDSLGLFLADAAVFSSGLVGRVNGLGVVQSIAIHDTAKHQQYAKETSNNSGRAIMYTGNLTVTVHVTLLEMKEGNTDVLATPLRAIRSHDCVMGAIHVTPRHVLFAGRTGALFVYERRDVETSDDLGELGDPTCTIHNHRMRITAIACTHDDVLATSQDGVMSLVPMSVVRGLTQSSGGDTATSIAVSEFSGNSVFGVNVPIASAKLLLRDPLDVVTDEWLWSTMDGDGVRCVRRTSDDSFLPVLMARDRDDVVLRDKIAAYRVSVVKEEQNIWCTDEASSIRRPASIVVPTLAKNLQIGGRTASDVWHDNIVTVQANNPHTNTAAFTFQCPVEFFYIQNRERTSGTVRKVWLMLPVAMWSNGAKLSVGWGTLTDEEEVVVDVLVTSKNVVVQLPDWKTGDGGSEQQFILVSVVVTATCGNAVLYAPVHTADLVDEMRDDKVPRLFFEVFVDEWFKSM